MSARFVGINSNQGAALQAKRWNVLFNPTCKLMAGNEGAGYLGGTNSPIFVVVKITAAQPDGCHLDQVLALEAFTQIEGCDPRIKCLVQK